MEQIEAKERERAEKEQVFKEESYEEIKLSDDKQAQVDTRKKELEAMLANMHLMESEFDDDLGADFEDPLDSLLKPDLSGFNVSDLVTSKSNKKLRPIAEEDSDD